jgi:hypothetical protein
MHTKLDSRFDVFAGVVNVNGPTRPDSKSIQENLKNTPVWLQHLDLPRKQHAVKPAQAFESIDSDRERLLKPVAKCICRHTPRPQFSENVDCARDLSEACFARAVDRAIPALLNRANEGQSWRENGITFMSVWSAALLLLSRRAVQPYGIIWRCDSKRLDVGAFSGAIRFWRVSP